MTYWKRVALFAMVVGVVRLAAYFDLWYGIPIGTLVMLVVGALVLAGLERE